MFRRENLNRTIFFRNIIIGIKYVAMHILMLLNIKISFLGRYRDALGHVNGNECFSSAPISVNHRVEWFVLLLVLKIALEVSASFIRLR